MSDKDKGKTKKKVDLNKRDANEDANSDHSVLTIKRNDRSSISIDEEANKKQ